MDCTVVGLCLFLKSIWTDTTNLIQLQEILLLCHSVRLRSVVIHTLLTSYSLSRAGTVLYVTIVNIILAMQINAMYKGNHYCGVFFGFLVVGEHHLHGMLQLSQTNFSGEFLVCGQVLCVDTAYHAFHVVLGGVFNMCCHGCVYHS